MKKRGVPFTRINTIMTHPQVLYQCANKLKRQYGYLTLTSGKGVAQALAMGDLPETVAVIGSRRLSHRNDLHIVDEYMQDYEEN